MKKLLVLLTAIITITLGGCGTDNVIKSEVETDQSAVKQPDNQEDTGMISMTIEYAKIKSLVGNEVELDFINNPYINEDDTEESGGMVSQLIAVPLDGSGDSSAEAQGPKLKVDYTGENKSMIIPAGVNIYDMDTRSELPLSSIKEGSVIMIGINDQTGEMVEIGVLEK